MALIVVMGEEGDFYPGGMSRGGKGEEYNGMGTSRDPGGFNKPGGLMDEGTDLDIDFPIDTGEGSDKSAIYVQGLSENVT